DECQLCIARTKQCNELRVLCCRVCWGGRAARRGCCLSPCSRRAEHKDRGKGYPTLEKAYNHYRMSCQYLMIAIPHIPTFPAFLQERDGRCLRMPSHLAPRTAARSGCPIPRMHTRTHRGGRVTAIAKWPP